VTSAAFATPISPISVADGGFAFPKGSRILRSSDFRKVYDEGFRFSCQHFAAFCLACDGQADGAKAGFTVSKAMGKAVVRNRMKRRMREAVRLHLGSLDSKWRVVFNPRKPVLDATREAIERDVERLIQRCKNF
jgi:ribonuclease P protein component